VFEYCPPGAKTWLPLRSTSVTNAKRLTCHEDPDEQDEIV